MFGKAGALQKRSAPAVMMNVVQQRAGSHCVVGDADAGELSNQEIHRHDELPGFLKNALFVLANPEDFAGGIRCVNAFSGLAEHLPRTDLAFQKR
ncbi:hypothetical protein SDC9_209847 [bioreactor metagenome]|uniref:Uncharacterized protein n=1 Tax=bioreactor metagenome TaxID=1076179 RepID=A0A645JES3_9ZZZZ